MLDINSARILHAVWHRRNLGGGWQCHERACENTKNSQTLIHVTHVEFVSCNRATSRPVHPPYSSVFSTEFNPEYGNTDLLFWLRKRSSPKYGNAHGRLNIFLR